MKSSMMALAVGAALAGCSTGDGNNVFAARDKTVEYYRVFDIKADPASPAVVKAASEGISKHVADATLATPGIGAQLADQPGHFKLAETGNLPPGAAPGGPSCEGAIWTAKATPRVNGGDNMNMIACLFPYKNGYHLDMYAVFTEKEGGWLEWPRRFKGRLMGTPETWTDQTMVDVVRTIRDSTGAQVALVEAKPALAGTPWLEMAPNKATSPTGEAPVGGASPAATPTGTPGGTGAASGVTATAAPDTSTGIAPIASTPAASSTEAASSPSTVATSGTDTKDGKTEVK